MFGWDMTPEQARWILEWSPSICIVAIAYSVMNIAKQRGEGWRAFAWALLLTISLGWYVRVISYDAVERTTITVQVDCNEDLECTATTSTKEPD